MLPIDRTTLALAQGNQVPYQVASSSKNINFLKVVADTIDELNVKVDTHASSVLLPHTDGSVSTAKIADLAVTTPKLAPLAVTTAKIAIGAVGAFQLDPTLLTDFGDIAVQAEFDRRGLNVMKYANLAVGTDWTAPIQAAIDSAEITGQTVIIPYGTYLTGTLKIHPGLTIIGIGFPTLKLKPNMPSFTPILTMEYNLWSATTPTEDSPPFSITGVILDGNQLNQGAYTGYQKEHQSAIFLQGASTSLQTDYRLRAIVDKCVIKNTCGDGISVWLSTDVTVTNTFFWNCFRGSVVQLGGNTVVRVNNISCGGDRHSSYFQAEIENNGRGELVLSNSYFDHLKGDASLGNGCEFGYGSGSSVQVDNCYFGAGIASINGTDAATYFNFNNCKSRQKATDTCVAYGQLKFSDCFLILIDGSTIGMSLRSFGASNLTATFDDCDILFENDRMASVASSGNITVATITNNLITLTFGAVHGIADPGNYGFTLVLLAGLTPAEYNGVYNVSGVPSSTQLTLKAQKDYGAITLSSATAKVVPTTRGIYNQSELATLNNQVIVKNCRFGVGLKHGFQNEKGGNFRIANNFFDSFAMANLSAGVGNNIKASFSGNKFMDNCRVYLAVECQDATTGRIDLKLANENVPITSSFVRRFVDTNGLFVTGHRTILDTVAPSTTQTKFPNDVYENSNAAVGYPTLYKNTGAYNFTDTWRQIQATIGKGTTANRPTLTTQDVGAVYLDTTLDADGKPIWWTGTAWVDATGLVV